MSEGLSTKSSRRQSWVNGAGGKEFHFGLEGLWDWHVVNDILLTTILNTHVPVPQWNLLILEHASGIITSVHDINFGQAADRSFTRGIDFSHDFQGLTCR